MLVAARLLGTATLGLVLLAGCADDGSDGADRPADSTPTSTSTSASASASPTTEPAATAPTASMGQPSEDVDPVSIAQYDADFAVTAAGDLTAAEKLTIEVSTDDRHGIYRAFDDDVAVEDFTATLDGSTTPVLDTRGDGQRLFRIGDPDRTLDVGEHTVGLGYHVGDVLTAGDERGARFDWMLVPDGWALNISAAHLTADLPAVATDAGCTVGEVECDVSGIGTTHLEIVTGELAPHTAVRLQVSMSDL